MLCLQNNDNDYSLPGWSLGHETQTVGKRKVKTAEIEGIKIADKIQWNPDLG